MKKKILVIDDEEILTRTFARMLEKSGYDVMMASRAEDALILAEEEPFDLILSDIRMPGDDGITLIRKIQDLFAKKNKQMPPVIFLTGYASPQQEDEGRKLNPLAYILKPFDVNELLKVINGQLQCM